MLQDELKRASLLKLAHRLEIPRYVTRRLQPHLLIKRILDASDQNWLEGSANVYLPEYLLVLLQVLNYTELHPYLVYYILSEEIPEDVVNFINSEDATVIEPSLLNILRRYVFRAPMKSTYFIKKYKALFSPEDIDLLDSKLFYSYFHRYLFDYFCTGYGVEDSLQNDLMKLDDTLSEDIYVFAPVYRVATEMDTEVNSVMIELKVSDVRDIVATYPEKKRLIKNTLLPETIYASMYTYHGMFGILFEIMEIPVTVENVKNARKIVSERLLLTLNRSTKKKYMELYRDMGLPRISNTGRRPSMSRSPERRTGFPNFSPGKRTVLDIRTLTGAEIRTLNSLIASEGSMYEDYEEEEKSD